MPVDLKMSAKVQESLGLPPGFKVFSSFPFGGMNQQASRIGMEDTEFFYRENFIKTGPGKLRTIWDQGLPIYTVTSGGPLIVSHFFFNIAAVEYAAVFLADGTAVQVQVSNFAQTVISASLQTFYVSGGILPACCQSGSQFLLIASNITANSYWIWDGSILYSAGSLGPVITITSGGSGYSSPPTIAAYGGSGSGASFTSAISGGSVVSIEIATPGTGYAPSDQVQLFVTGGGTDSGAELVAVLGSGTIGAINVTSGGSGYASVPAVTIAAPGGGGTTATATAAISGGQVTGIIITNAGAGYTGTPAVTIGGPGGGGVTATAAALLAGGSVASVTVVAGGTNFTGTPTLTIVGGGGTGAAATANLTAGVISSVTVTDGGTGYTSVPAVVVQSGINNAASATVELMPFGVSGSCIETFQSHVWLPAPNQTGQTSNGGTFLVSAPESLTDFATSDGGLIFQNSDRFLRATYVNIRQSNGYLYPFGDSSVSVVSNVQTTGNPSDTTFNYQNVDPQIGMAWRDSCQDFSRTILFANALGVFGLYGGAVTKISKKIDDIFDNAIFPPTSGAVTPSSAVANIHTIRTYLVLLTIKDPFSEAMRTVMLAWDEAEWFVVSQSSALTYISTQEVNSDLTAWGTDGSSLFPLMQTASPAISKKLSSKLFGAENAIITKQALAFYVQASDHSIGQEGVTLDVTCDTEVGSLALPNGPIDLTAVPPFLQMKAVSSGDVYGQELGYTLTSTSLDFEIDYLALGIVDFVGVFGDIPGPPGESE